LINFFENYEKNRTFAKSKVQNTMPRISEFYGILILMNFKDHNPPHFHVWYGEYKASIEIENGIVVGEMPQRALKMVFDWLEMHKPELMDMWANAKAGKPIGKIAPLV
jgi:hypothetical protein